MRHVISALVQNKSGVLAHISGLFSARGFNIDSLCVGETENPNLSRMTIVVAGDDTILEQVRKQLGKVIDVVKVQDYSGKAYVERDLALIKVSVPPSRRNEILPIVDIFRAKVVDVGPETLVIEIAGQESKIEGFIELMKPYGIKELVRAGIIAMTRSTK